MTEQENPKQWIIIRKDLKMRKGKIASQAAHASMKVIFDLWKYEDVNISDRNQMERKLIPQRWYGLKIDHDSALFKWISGTFTKITLSVDSEEELLELYNKAKEEGLPCSLVEDRGLTEFNGVKTKTAIAIGPAYPSQVQHLTGELKML